MPSCPEKSFDSRFICLQPALRALKLEPMASNAPKRSRKQARLKASPSRGELSELSIPILTWLRANKLSFRNNANWRMTPRIRGHIHGLDNLSGTLVATDGILCCLENGGQVLTNLHLQFFVADEEDEALLDEVKGVSQASSRAKQHARLFADFL